MTPSADTKQRVATALLVLVAIVAGLASFSHIRHLAMENGQPAWLATLYPVTTDVMILGATIELRLRRRVHLWPSWFALLAGVAASGWANWTDAAAPTLTSRAISSWPVFVFLLTVHVVAGKQRSAPKADTRHVDERRVPGTRRVYEPVESVVPVTAVPATDHSMWTRNEWPWTPDDVSAVPGWVKRESLEPDADTLTETSEPSPGTPETLAPSAVQMQTLRHQEPSLNQREVAERLGVSLTTVKRYWSVTAPPINGKVPLLS